MDILDNLKDSIELSLVSTGGKYIAEFKGKIKIYLNV
jgi:hypothetical protein